MTRFVMLLLQTRWGMFLCAIVAAVIGVVAITFTVPAHYVRIDGAVASYTVVNNVAGAYDHNELRLVGDSTVYKLDDSEYSPAPPDSLPAGVQVSVWVDQGHPWIMAMTITGAAHTYTTFPYDHPDQNLLAGRIAGGVFIGIGALLALMTLAWKRLPWRRQPKPSYTPAYLAPGMYDEDQRRP